MPWQISSDLESSYTPSNTDVTLHELLMVLNASRTAEPTKRHILQKVTADHADDADLPMQDDTRHQTALNAYMQQSLQT